MVKCFYSLLRYRILQNCKTVFFFAIYYYLYCTEYTLNIHTKKLSHFQPTLSKQTPLALITFITFITSIFLIIFRESLTKKCNNYPEKLHKYKKY